MWREGVAAALKARPQQQHSAVTLLNRSIDREGGMRYYSYFFLFTFCVAMMSRRVFPASTISKFTMPRDLSPHLNREESGLDSFSSSLSDPRSHSLHLCSKWFTPPSHPHHHKEKRRVR